MGFVSSTVHNYLSIGLKIFKYKVKNDVMSFHMTMTSNAMNARPTTKKKWLISDAADAGVVGDSCGVVGVSVLFGQKMTGSVSGLQISGVFETGVVD